LFKPGYKWVGLDNYPLSTYSTDSVRKSDWNGKTIKMERFKGAPKEYATHLDLMPLHKLIEDCEWKNIPQMIIAVSGQSDKFHQLGVVPELYSIERYLPTNLSKCGSPNEFFKSYKP